MSGVLWRVIAVWFAGSFGFSGLYSIARSRRLEAALYCAATVSVFVMVATAVK